MGGFCTIVALAMGEIASTYPTAGGLYFWSSKLGGPAWGWFTGWFNLIGQIAVTAAIDYGAAIFTTSLLNLWFPDQVPNTAHGIFVTFSVIMALHLLLNLLGVRLLAGLNSDLGVDGTWLGVALIVLVLIVVPDHHQSASYVFAQTINNSGFQGHSFANPIFWFVFGIGLLMAQYTITGYDASAHMSEETRNASRAAAWGIVMSVVVSVIFGFVAARGDHLRDPRHEGRTRRRRQHRHLHLGDVDEPEVGRVPARDRLRRPVLLRHGVGHLGLADDVRLLPRRRDPGIPAVAARLAAAACRCMRSARSPSSPGC